MFPDLSYIANYFFEYPIDGNLSKFDTIRLFAILGYLAFITLFLRGIFEKKIIAQIPFSIILTGIFFSTTFSIFGGYFFASLENLEKFSFTISFLFGNGCHYLGILLFGIFGSYLYCKLRSIVIWSQLLDICSYALMFNYAFLRIGCHLSGDGCRGIENKASLPNYWIFPNWTWSFDYPNDILNEGVLLDNFQGNYCHKLSFPVFPTSFYEAIISLILGFILYIYRKKLETHYGMLFNVFLLFMGTQRFFIEFIRPNPKFDLIIFKFSQAQIISLIMIFIALINFIIYFKTKILLRYRKPQASE